MAEAARKDNKEAEAQVKANQEAREKNNADAIERMEKTQPTPTQAENDLAAAGVAVEEHEPDGSPLQGLTAKETEELQKKQSKPAGGAPYQTRAATPKT